MTARSCSNRASRPESGPKPEEFRDVELEIVAVKLRCGEQLREARSEDTGGRQGEDREHGS